MSKLCKLFYNTGGKKSGINRIYFRIFKLFSHKSPLSKIYINDDS